MIGSKKFVNDVFEHSREYFGENRKTGTLKMQGVKDTGTDCCGTQQIHHHLAGQCSGVA